MRNPSGPQESENLTGWTSPLPPPEEDPREQDVDTAETSDQVTVPWNRFRLLPERTGAAVVGGCWRWRGGVREVHKAASYHRRYVTRGSYGSRLLYPKSGVKLQVTTPQYRYAVQKIFLRKSSGMYDIPEPLCGAVMWAAEIVLIRC